MFCCLQLLQSQHMFRAVFFNIKSQPSTYLCLLRALASPKRFKSRAITKMYVNAKMLMMAIACSLSASRTSQHASLMQSPTQRI